MIGIFSIAGFSYIAFKAFFGEIVKFDVGDSPARHLEEEMSWSSCNGEVIKLTQAKGIKLEVGLVVSACDKAIKGPQIRVSVFKNLKLIEQQTIDVIFIENVAQGEEYTSSAVIEKNFNIIVNVPSGYFVPAIESEYYSLKQKN